MSLNENSLLRIWQKAYPIPGFDSSLWRRDKYGYAIKYTNYGKREDYGWEADHIIPKSNGGSSHENNLQPLHWENNARKSDKLIF